MEITNINLPVIAEVVSVEKAVETPSRFYLCDFNNPVPLNKKEGLEEMQPEDYTKY